MRVLIVSDTHGHHEYFVKAVRAAGKIDMVIHCGDSEGGENEMRSIVENTTGTLCPCIFVRGNNDYAGDLRSEAVVSVSGHKVFVTHGHRYSLYMGFDTLSYAANEREADVVLFGHTHKPCIETYAGIWMVNPGSLSYPRQEGRKATYIIMESDTKGELHFELFFL